MYSDDDKINEFMMLPWKRPPIYEKPTYCEMKIYIILEYRDCVTASFTGINLF